jgi:DNA primase large subunit
LNQHIQAFSQIHQYDEPEQLLTQFEEWFQKEPIKSLVAQEQIYLSRHNYDLPIDVKIFKSIKYYYIKKEKSEETVKDVPKRSIVRVPKEVLSQMVEKLDQAFLTDPTFKPSRLFDPRDYPEDLPSPMLKKAFNNQYYQMKHKKYGLTLDV